MFKKSCKWEHKWAKNMFPTHNILHFCKQWQ